MFKSKFSLKVNTLSTQYICICICINELIACPQQQVLSIGLWYKRSESHSSIITDHGREGLFYEIPWDGGLHEERDSEAVYAQSGHHFYARREPLCPRAAPRAGE